MVIFNLIPHTENLARSKHLIGITTISLIYLIFL